MYGSSDGGYFGGSVVQQNCGEGMSRSEHWWVMD